MSEENKGTTYAEDAGSKVEELKLSEYPQLVDVIKEIRQEKEEPIYFPKLGKSYDGGLILRCRRTIEPDIYLMVITDNVMFYVINDIGADLGQVNSL